MMIIQMLLGWFLDFRDRVGLIECWTARLTLDFSGFRFQAHIFRRRLMSKVSFESVSQQFANS